MHTLRARLSPLPGDAVWIAGATAFAVLGAAVFTVSAYRLSPWALPALAIAAAAALVILVRPAWGLALAFLTTPLEVFSVQLGPTALSPAEASLAFVGAAWYARLLVGGQARVGIRPADLPLAILLAAVAVGIVTSDEPFTVARVLMLWTLYVGAYFQARELDREQIRLALTALAVGVGVLGTIGALRYLQSGQTGLLEGGLVTKARAIGAFSDANYYASLLTLGLLPGIALVLALPRRFGWLVVVLAGGTAGLVFSLSRGAIAAFAISLLVLLAWRRARWLALGLTLLFVATTLANANPITKSQQFEVVSERLSTLNERTLSATTNRPRIWSTAITVAEQHPFFGVGVNQFKHQAATHDLSERGHTLENAHSIPLSLAAETGLIGLAAFLAFYVQLFGRALGALRRLDAASFAITLGLASALLAFALQGLTVAQIRVNVIFAVFMAVAGMLTAMAWSGDETPAPEPDAEQPPAQD